MPDPTEPLRENPSAYFVQDRSNEEEMARLEVQDKMLTTGMGGALPELADPTSLQRVLDVGCGTGGWLFEMARTYPTIEKLVGGDISSKMLAYARARAKAQDLDGRVQFQPMDALRVLEFPAASFDLVNQRAGLSWLRTWEWKKILLEYQRVCRPGGIIRITECTQIIESNSPALTKYCHMWLEVNYNSGRLFTKSTDGVTGELVHLLTQHGIEDVQERVYPLVYRAGEASGQYLYEDMSYAFRVSLPYFQKWINVPSDYQEIRQQALKEMLQPDFVATWTWRTAWGTRPERGGTIRMRGLQ
jgi:ubiquinone/menaquinone biosynthesis C-methylase UbiE